MKPLCLPVLGALTLGVLTLVGRAWADDAPRAAAIGSAVDFQLPDLDGKIRRLADFDEELVSLIFVGVDCPLTRLYAERVTKLASTYQGRVALVAIDSNRRDDVEEISVWRKELGLAVPVLVDAKQQAANACGATRNPEVFLLDRQRKVRYHGRIDDQFTTAGHLKAPRREDLKAAIDELLEGKPVSAPETEMTGCVIDRPVAAGNSNLTWHRDIHPIIRRRCETCHMPGESGPFELSNYEQTVSWLATIREAVTERRMPPWLPSRKHGEFANNRDLTDAERAALLEWIASGAAEGDPKKAAPLEPLPQQLEWLMTKPDLVFRIPEPYQVPAKGVIDYVNVAVDPQFAHDVWVNSAEVRPTARGVVHHCNVYLAPPGADTTSIHLQGELGSYFLASIGKYELPPGMAKRVPAGWRFVFSVHYIPNGKVVSDQIGMALKISPASEVRQEVATRGMIGLHLEIPPHEPDYVCAMSERLHKDMLLLALLPHMHLRGRTFRYEAEYPDGTREILLDIPRWKFDWEGRIELARPKLLPAGTVLYAAAHYDNSSANPVNPDPSAVVKTGPQIEDEMFNAFYDVVDARQDLIHSRTLRHLMLGLCGALAVGLAAAWVVVRFRSRSARSET